jgi:predicted transcriptional regulator
VVTKIKAEKGGLSKSTSKGPGYGDRVEKFKNLMDLVEPQGEEDMNKLMLLFDLYDEKLEKEADPNNIPVENTELDHSFLSSLNHRRSDIEILALILKITRVGAIKTQILYQANLSYYQLKNYLKFLIKAGFIEKNGSTKRKAKYTTTQKGNLFLYHWANIQNLF